MSIVWKHNFVAISLFAAIFAIDQFIKYKSILNYNYYLNSGLIFGYGDFNTLAIVIAALLFLLVLYLIIFKKVALFPLTIIAAGLFSNLIDRFIYKGVIDYWWIYILQFNLSDVLIWLVIIIGAITYIWTKKDSKARNF